MTRALRKKRRTERRQPHERRRRCSAQHNFTPEQIARGVVVNACTSSATAHSHHVATTQGEKGMFAWCHVPRKHTVRGPIYNQVARHEEDDSYWADQPCLRFIRDPETNEVIREVFDATRREPGPRRPIHREIFAIYDWEKPHSGFHRLYGARENERLGTLLCSSCIAQTSYGGLQPYKCGYCKNPKCEELRTILSWSIRPKTGGRPTGEARKEARAYDQEHAKPWRHSAKEEARRWKIRLSRHGHRRHKDSALAQRTQEEWMEVEQTEIRLSPRKPRRKNKHKDQKKIWPRIYEQERRENERILIEAANDEHTFHELPMHPASCEWEKSPKWEEKHLYDDHNPDLRGDDYFDDYLRWWKKVNGVETSADTEESERFARHMTDSGTVREFLEDELAAEEAVETKRTSSPPKRRRRRKKNSTLTTCASAT